MLNVSIDMIQNDEKQAIFSSFSTFYSSSACPDPETPQLLHLHEPSLFLLISRAKGRCLINILYQ